MVHKEVHEYLVARTVMVRVLWPREQAVTVHALGGSVNKLTASDTLEGEELLPGFAVLVWDLFNVQR